MPQFVSLSANAEQDDWNLLPSADVFARITRNGATDIYLVQNHVGFCWDGRISIGFHMDDFNRNRPKDSYGVPVYLRKTDHIECLGEPREYFSPLSASWDIKGLILRSLPRTAGLLPAVRAYETLVRSDIDFTDESIGRAASNAYLDYVKRRSKLNS